MNELADVIAADPPAAAKVLKIANSPYYGFKQTIGTINQAVTILGFGTLKNALLTMSTFDQFGNKCSGLDLPGLWLHSLATAAAGRLLAEHLGFTYGDKIYSAGLLHDLGRVIIAKYVPHAMLRAQDLSSSRRIPLLTAELHTLGASHADVGAWLLNRWKLPTDIIEAVRFHHQPLRATENFDMTAMVYLANILAHQSRLGNSGDKDNLTVDARVSSYFKLSEEDWFGLRNKLAAKNLDIITTSGVSSVAA